MYKTLITKLRTYFLGLVDVYGTSVEFDLGGMQLTEEDILAELTSRSDD